MTNEQIRARCEQVLFDVDKIARDYESYEYGLPVHLLLTIDSESRTTADDMRNALESLYREAMAAGLERAARSMEAMLDMPGSTDDQAWAHVGWCLAEAQRVKEGT